MNGCTNRELLIRCFGNEGLAMKFYAILTSFSVDDVRLIERQLPPKEPFKCPIEGVDEYFQFVASNGRPGFTWEIISPAFLWKLELVIMEMRAHEKQNPLSSCINPIISDEEFEWHYQFIMRKALDFKGTPFTIQRLCELLSAPLQLYKRTDKFLRAIEKNINVVTCVTECGERITGAEEFPVYEDDIYQRIEQPFFVDECEMMDTEACANAYGSKENNDGQDPACTKMEEDPSPINLSGGRESSQSVEWPCADVDERCLN